MSEIIEAAPKARKEVVKQFKVTIHSGEDKADKGDVFLSHNFKNILIQRDQEVVIGEQYVEVLENSTIQTVEKDAGGVERTVRIPRFSFNVKPA